MRQIQICVMVWNIIIFPSSILMHLSLSFYTDFDECADPSSNNCSLAENQECINTLGSFICQCNAGYSMQSGGGCEGIFKLVHLLIELLLL